MNIYFAWSIKWSPNGRETYPHIIQELNKYGNVLTEHIGKVHNDPSQNIAQAPAEVFQYDSGMINNADILIAEITGPSLGVWREICYAQFVSRIPVHCLYQKWTNISRMISGNRYIALHPYNNISQITSILESIVKLSWK